MAIFPMTLLEAAFPEQQRITALLNGVLLFKTFA